MPSTVPPPATRTSGTPRPLGPVAVAALAVCALIAAQMPTFLTAGVAVQMQEELRFGPSILGTVLALSLAASALGSIALGRLVQAVGWSWGLRLAAVCSALTMTGIALLARSWVWLAVLLVFGGAAKALGHPAANLVVASEGSPRHQGLLFGVKQAGVPATTTLAGLSVPAIALTLGWRASFLAAAALTVLSAALVPARPRPDPVSRAPDAAGGRRDGVDRARLLVLAVGAGLGVAVGNSIAAFLTSYAVGIGLAPGRAGLLLALASGTGLVMRVLLGWLSDRLHLGLRAVAALMLVGVCGVVLLSSGSPTTAVLGSLLGLGAGWGWAGLFNRAVVQRNPTAVAAATGFTQVGVFAGAGLGPLAFGVLAEEVSFRAAWLALAAVGAAGAVTMLVDAARDTAPPLDARAAAAHE